MSRQKLTLRLNENVIKKAKEMEINISGFLEIRLQEYYALLEGKPNNLDSYSRLKKRYRNTSSGDEKGLWSSGYDVAFTRRRSPVQIRLSPCVSFNEKDIENFLNILELSGIKNKHKKEDRAYGNYEARNVPEILISIRNFIKSKNIGIIRFVTTKKKL